MKKILAAILCALFALVPLSACGESGEGRTTIRLNEVTHSVFYAPMYAAEALGYFEEENIEIELTNGGGADAVMAAVLSGSADIGFCGPEAALYVLVGGSNNVPTVFGQLTKRDGSFLVSRADEADTFDWATSLEGKEILAGRKGGVPAMTFEYILNNNGLYDGQNVDMNYDINFNYMTAAFEAGTADYCTMFEPVASEYEKAGKGYVVASVGEASGEVPYTCYIARENYIAENEEVIEGFLRAVMRGIAYVNESGDAEAAKLLAPYFDGTELSSIETPLKSYKAIDAWQEDMTMTEDAFENDVREKSGARVGGRGPDLPHPHGRDARGAGHELLRVRGGIRRRDRAFGLRQDDGALAGGGAAFPYGGEHPRARKAAGEGKFLRIYVTEG